MSLEVDKRERLFTEILPSINTKQLQKYSLSLFINYLSITVCRKR